MRFKRFKVIMHLSVLVLFFFAAPTIEGKFFPVVGKFSNVDVERHEKHLVVTFEAEKLRTCRILEMSALVRVKGEFVNGNVTLLSDVDQSGKPLSKPIGRHTYGPWRVEPSGNAFILYAHHDCHPIWHTATPMVTWDSGTKSD